MNEIPLSVPWGILASMLLLSAFFSGAKAALMALNRYRLKYLVKTNQRSAYNTQRLLLKSDYLNSLISLGNHAVNFTAAIVTANLAMDYYRQQDVAAAVAVILAILLILVFCDLIPSRMAAVKPEKLAFTASWVIYPLLILFYPLLWLINQLTNWLMFMFGLNFRKKPATVFSSKEELRSIVNDAGNLIPPRYQKMLLGILDLESATVEDIMTPRHEIVGLDLDEPLPEIIRKIKNSPHTRLPVYRKSIDNVEGFLHLRNILILLEQTDFNQQTILGLLSKPVFIPDATPVHNQIHRFKMEKIRIGLVVDEYGDVTGLVTLDDLLQEIVGELITDDITVRQQSDGSYLVDANITVREFNRITQWSLPTEGPKTLNGLIIEFMETIPEAGTSIKLHGYALEILKRDESSVKLVKFLPEPGLVPTR